MGTNAVRNNTITAQKSSGSHEIPKFVFDHAPIFHLYTTDRYRPSSLNAFLGHTRPKIDFKDTAIPSPPLTLANLDQLNSLAAERRGEIYLTSSDDVTKNPDWLDGVKVSSDNGTGNERTGVIIIVDKGMGVVDVFYFVFWAFNWGGIVLEKQLGNHVGDWEHTMIRFVNGVPKYVWLSQHANGEAYAFKALEKDNSGRRPVLYIANGSHAIYARTGKIDHTIPNFNLNIPFLLVDDCDKGPLFDPLLTSHIYSYTISPMEPNKKDSTAPEVTGKFKNLDSAAPPPGWLYFIGRWGDQEYPADDPKQKNKDLFGFRKYGSGPTGPAFKELARKDVWPANSYAAGQKIRTSLDGSTGLRDRLSRWGWRCFGRKKSVYGRMKDKEVQRVDVDGRTIG